MNRRVPAHKRYQPTKYEHVANCATHAVSQLWGAERDTSGVGEEGSLFVLGEVHRPFPWHCPRWLGE